ncbi:MAG TPA: AMP-binding protein, partial [Polyangiales bacterium]
FDSLFVFENAPLAASLQEHARALGVRTLSNRTHTNYPLTVVVIPGPELCLQLSADTGRFAADEVRRWLGCFKQLVVAMAAHPEATLGELQHLSPLEQRELLHGAAGPQAAYEFERGYAASFEAQVRLHGERTAARQRDRALSYAELNRAANRIAHGLRAAGVSHDRVVALWGERSPDLLSGVLGALKAGAAFLALDTSLPPQRLANMIRASGCEVLLALDAADPIAAVVASLPQPPRVLHAADFSDGPQHDLQLRAHPEAAAYVIYTSGSTGEPKGVQVTLRGMLNNQLSKIPYLGLSHEDVIAQTAATSFDISVWQMLAGLLCGACIEVVPTATARDPRALLEHVRLSGITVLQSVPTLIAGMLEAPVASLPRLRWLLPTGEACPGELARRWLERYPSVPLINAYGPAECADDVSLHVCR